MSTIAKIFTVLNVILAAAFLGWAANAVQLNNDYKQQLEKAQADSAAYQQAMGVEKSALAGKLSEAEQARTRLQTELETAKAENARVENDNKANAQVLQTLEADVKQVRTTLEGVQADAKAAHEAQVKALAAQHDAESKAKDAAAAQLAAEAKASGLEGDLIAKNEELAAKEKALASAEKERESVKTQLATVVAATNFDLKSVQAMPLIEGNVIAIELGVEPGLVSINRGESSGVKRGFTFELYQGTIYKGQARVEYVRADSCSAVLVRKVKGETIRQGDGAITRL